jgi:hypothetical protein
VLGSGEQGGGEDRRPGADLSNVFSFRVTRPVRVVVGLGIALGLAVRLWYVTHDTLSADGAMNGLQGESILHGHFTAFYPGQVYGGVGGYLSYWCSVKQPSPSA